MQRKGKRNNQSQKTLLNWPVKDFNEAIMELSQHMVRVLAMKSFKKPVQMNQLIRI